MPDLEADRFSGDARATVAAELESGEPVGSVPVVPPGRMADMRAEWRRDPSLSLLIRAAGRLGEAEVAKSRLARALWEMARSPEWKTDGRGLLADFPEFAERFGERA